ncbi:MAG: nickel insertion protein, partial [Halobacteriota archaeon]
MRTLAVDGRMGASGDMLLGALLAAGADRSALAPVEAVLPVRYVVETVDRNGIEATTVSVQYTETAADGHRGHHSETHEGGHDHAHDHESDEHDHGHTHGHEHDRGEDGHEHDRGEDGHEHDRGEDGHEHGDEDHDHHAEGHGPTRTLAE